MQREVIRIGQLEIRFLLEEADTGGAVAMFEFIVPAGARVPLPHSHVHYDETICGLDGVLTLNVEGRTIKVGAGEACFIPRGAVHGFDNPGPAVARALAVVTPARIGPVFFRETAAIVNAGGPPDLERLKAVLSKHGLVAAPPQGLPRVAPP